MNYELAKKLKDAGFPQEGNGKYWETTQAGPHTGHFVEKPETQWCVYIPTLSELIAACGNDFFRLESMVEGWECRGRNVQNSYGSTPEEAVVKLWLSLRGITIK